MYYGNSHDGESEEEVHTFASIGLAACAPLFSQSERVKEPSAAAGFRHFYIIVDASILRT